MIITRPVIFFTTPAEVGDLKEYLLSTTHAVNSVVSILAFALLLIALVGLYDREARSAGKFGALGLRSGRGRDDVHDRRLVVYEAFAGHA
jgi:hypothetical protein